MTLFNIYFIGCGISIAVLAFGVLKNDVLIEVNKYVVNSKIERLALIPFISVFWPLIVMMLVIQFARDKFGWRR